MVAFWEWAAATLPIGAFTAHGCYMTHTTIDVDEVLTAEVMRRFGLTTEKAAIDLALRRLLGVPLRREFLLSLEGVAWEGNLGERPNESVD